MFKNMEDFQQFSKDQLDAATVTATTLSKGAQQIAVEATDYSKKSLESSTAFLEKLLGAKSLDKAMEIQSAYAKSSYESFVAQATRMGEIYANMTKEAFKPMESAFAKVQAVAQPASK